MSIDSPDPIEESPTAIKHNSYYDGKVQSLGFSRENNDATVGVLEPGEYDFGRASRRETIKVVHGTLHHIPTNRDFSESQVLTVEPGEEIKLSCAEHVAYVCYYG